MVRLEDADDRDLEGGGTSASCCTVPAGESPVRVGAGAPGSRPQARGEIFAAQAGRQEPPRREQERGPQREEKPAASSEKQWESRAAHVTAKAMSTAQSSGTESVEGLPGVGATMSGPIWEREHRRVFLQRWPSQRSMKRVRQRVKELTGPHRNGVRDVRVLVRDINPVLRGWGNYFRTGNAARKFNQLDSHVWSRLHRFLVKRQGRHLRPGQAEAWDRDFFWGLGLHRLRGTVRYPGAA